MSTKRPSKDGRNGDVLVKDFEQGRIPVALEQDLPEYWYYDFHYDHDDDYCYYCYYC